MDRLHRRCIGLNFALLISPLTLAIRDSVRVHVVSLRRPFLSPDPFKHARGVSGLTCLYAGHDALRHHATPTPGEGAPQLVRQ